MLRSRLGSACELLPCHGIDRHRVASPFLLCDRPWFLQSGAFDRLPKFFFELLQGCLPSIFSSLQPTAWQSIPPPVAGFHLQDFVVLPDLNERSISVKPLDQPVEFIVSGCELECEFMDF